MAAGTRTPLRRPQVAPLYPMVGRFIVWLSLLAVISTSVFGQEVEKNPRRWGLWNGLKSRYEQPPKPPLPTSGKTEAAKQTALWMRRQAVKHAHRGEFSRAMQLAKRADALSVYVDWQPHEQSPAAFMRDLKSIQKYHPQGVASVANSKEPARFQIAAPHVRTTSRDATQQYHHRNANDAIQAPPGLATNAETETIVLGNSRLDWTGVTYNRFTNSETTTLPLYSAISSPTPSQYAFRNTVVETHAVTPLPVDAEWSHKEATESEATAHPQAEIAIVSATHTAGVDPVNLATFDWQDVRSRAIENMIKDPEPTADARATPPTESLQSRDETPETPVTQSPAKNVEYRNETFAGTEMRSTAAVASRPMSPPSFSGLMPLAAFFCAILLSFFTLTAIVLLMLRRYGLPAMRVELVGEHGQRILTLGTPEQHLQAVSPRSNFTAYANQMQLEEESSKRQEAAMLKHVFEQNVRLRKEISQGV